MTVHNTVNIRFESRRLHIFDQIHLQTQTGYVDQIWKELPDVVGASSPLLQSLRGTLMSQDGFSSDIVEL